MASPTRQQERFFYRRRKDCPWRFLEHYPPLPESAVRDDNTLHTMALKALMTTGFKGSLTRSLRNAEFSQFVFRQCVCLRQLDTFR